MILPRQQLLDGRVRQVVRAAINVANGQASTTPFHLITAIRGPIAIRSVSVARVADTGITKEIQHITNADSPAEVTDVFRIRVTNPITGAVANTASLAHNVSAADMQTALNGLANVETGELVVGTRTGSGTNYTWPITFHGRYAQANPAPLTVSKGDSTYSNTVNYTTTTAASVTVTTNTAWAVSADLVTFNLAAARADSVYDPTQINSILPTGLIADPDNIGQFAFLNGVKGTYQTYGAPTDFSALLRDPNVQDSLGFPIVPKGFGVWGNLHEDLASGPTGTVDLIVEWFPLANEYGNRANT